MSGKRSCQLKMPLQPSLCSSNSTVPVQRLALWCDISEITFKTSGHSTTETLWFGAEGETGIISVAEPNKLCFSRATHLTLQVGTHEVEHYLFLAHFAIFKAKKKHLEWHNFTNYMLENFILEKVKAAPRRGTNHLDIPSRYLEGKGKSFPCDLWELFTPWEFLRKSKVDYRSIYKSWNWKLLMLFLENACGCCL